jgi:preprotein translocase subunit SecF
MDIIKHKWWFIGIFLLAMCLCVIFIFVNPYNGWGQKPGSALNLGVDFTGGTKIYFPVDRPVTSDEVTEVLETIDLPDFNYNPPQPNEYIDSNGDRQYQVLVYTRFLNDAEQGIVIDALEAKFGDAEQTQGLDITRVAPLIGKELLTNSLIAVLIAIALMLVYIWFRFELLSGIAAIVALVHDSLFVIGAFALFGLEVNVTMIAAILTVIGYSINDTIVVFDRIRENLNSKPKDATFDEVANDSILQTFRRSLNTSFTTVVAILVMFLAVPNLREFLFALIVGMTAGTYSSIFVASPIWSILKDWLGKKRYA